MTTADSCSDATAQPSVPASGLTIDAGQWNWHAQGELQWLRCSLLEDWPHAFGSRHNASKTPAQLTPSHIGRDGDLAYWTKQVHGDRLVWSEDLAAASQDEDLKVQSEADAVATETAGHSVWVRTADCVPVLIADRERVAAIHSGWRGTAGQIVSKTAQSLIQKGAKANALRVAIGPAISGPVYQVSKEVADRVLATISGDPEIDLPPLTYTDPSPDKVRLDLRATIVRQLLAIGILKANISVSPHCTWSEPDNFFSYRRIQSPPSPVQWSGIGL